MSKINQLPDDNTLDQLIELAEKAEIKAKNLCNLATEIDEKWRKKLENRRKEQLKIMSIEQE